MALWWNDVLTFCSAAAAFSVPYLQWMISNKLLLRDPSLGLLRCVCRLNNTDSVYRLPYLILKKKCLLARHLTSYSRESVSDAFLNGSES